MKEDRFRITKKPINKETNKIEQGFLLDFIIVI